MGRTSPTHQNGTTPLEGGKFKIESQQTCIFYQKIIFLGHVVGKVRTKPNLDKIKVVVEFPILKIVTNVQTFLGLTGYYKNYIKGYARIIIPLFELTKRDVTFEWTLEGQKAFDKLKQAFIFTPILARPYFCKGFFMDMD